MGPNVDVGATYLGRLADFLSDDLPLVCLVLLDCVTEFYRLQKVSGGTRGGANPLRFDHQEIIPHLRRIQRNAYPG